MRSFSLLVLAACSGGGDDVALDGHSHSGTEEPSCDGAETYVDGIAKTTSATGATVSITSADPTPPDVGDNTWTLTVEDAAGPVSGLPLVVEPWMPLHGHGLVPAEYAGVDQGDGTYQVDTFDLIMPGLWEFRVKLAPGAADPDEAVFAFCAEG